MIDLFSCLGTCFPCLPEVFRKEPTLDGVVVQIYFWDERDGPNFSGWWFGPVIGGDQVALAAVP